MNISSKGKYPSNALSNFSIHQFTLDGVNCASMEGFLQGLKFKDINIQEHVCSLVGIYAKRRGSKRNKAWKTKQSLWWRGEEIDRHSDRYQDLLDSAYSAMFNDSDSFRRALKASGKSVFSHSIGSRKKQDTVLTVSEFCNRLTALRKLL